MEFELKDAYSVGSVVVGDTTSTQHINVRAGVVGLPDEAKYKLPEQTIVYTFDNTLSIADAKTGMETFAAQWVVDNYPTI